ncbi:MAG: Unknown protein [uncultured Sulfurovum sp.]|uniref:Transketolase n=1 Tax=uncultured Sulfurovum sp. TaxID=269237 RepID=A0A6S6RTQ1_9BACT|nr:MAG: Unknown protein [uncultured Sulfurovum sp.]
MTDIREVKNEIKKNSNNRFEELKKFFFEIEHKLKDDEIERMKLELDLIECNINEIEHHKVLELLVKELKINNLQPLNTNVLEVLDRSYEVSEFGCRSSCISSANMVLEIEKLLEREDSNSYEFISVKGHMAPFMYANAYVKQNFSLLYLYALHYSDIISPVLKEKFISNSVNVDYNLGYGLGKVLSKMMINPQKKYIVLMGDSDLSFGATLEALMYIKTQNYNNITLIIDFNKFGFEARPDGFDSSILRSFFDKTIEIDESEIENNLDFSRMIFSFNRGAVFVNTKKENHKITLFSARDLEEKSTVHLTKKYAEAIVKLNHKYQKELRIFTPDLASRFFLQENNLSYVNTTVAEALTPILAIGQNDFSAIATDQKYSTNMIGSILELYKNTGKVLLTLAKSWDYWGGEANALNILNTLPETTVYEACTEKELKYLLERHYIYPSYKTILSVCDVELPKIDFEPRVKEANYLIENGSKDLVISFGIATALVHNIAKELDIDHVHFAKMRLNYDEALQDKLNEYDHVYIMEYNGKRHGFGEHFLSLFNLKNYTIKASKDTIPQMKAIEQIKYHEFDRTSLIEFFEKRNII